MKLFGKPIDLNFGHLVVLIPIAIIIYILFFHRSSVPAPREEFLNIGDVGRTVVDKFESTFFSPELQQLTYRDDDVKGAVNMTEQAEEAPAPEPVPEKKQKMDCKFVPEGSDCPVGYSFTGATIEGSDLKCGESKPVSEEAVLKAVVDSGSVSRVEVVKGGKGYSQGLTIEFSSKTGSGARAQAEVDDNGSVVLVEVAFGGSGYDKPPVVRAVQEKIAGCNLCCADM